MGISVEDEIVSRATSKMGCCTLTTPFLYPGVKVGGSMSRIKAWDEIDTKLHSYLSKWKMKTLSSGCRLTLLKSVLGSSLIYYMSIYKVPSKVLKCLEDIRRKFFIGADVKEKKMSWFKWSTVLALKDKGGLGVSSFFALNIALLFKWMWRFFNDKDALWYRFVRAVNGNSRGIETHSRVSYSSTWLSIVNEVNKIRNKGIDLLKYMRIYALESDKNLTVADTMAHNDTAFSLRRQPRDGVEMEQFRALSIVIEGVLLHDMVDRWKWTLEGSGEFPVASARKFIDNSRLIGSPKKTRWIKMVPFKVNILAWKVQFDLLPTRLNLSRRGLFRNIKSCWKGYIMLCGGRSGKKYYLLVENKNINVSKRTKSGDRFAFVRFIRIKDVDRLVKSVCTLRMGRLRLHANVARFQRPPLNKAQHVKGENVGQKSFGVSSNNKVFSVSQSSYAGTVKNNGEHKQVAEMDSKPSLVIDESCGILCAWDSRMFHNHNTTISDYCVAIQGEWIENAKKYLVISVYAPQEASEKRMLWSYLNHMIDRQDGESILLGDFNEVRHKDEHFGSIFNNHNAMVFNSFISSSGLVEVPIGGCAFTWCHKYGSKMSKLDLFYFGRIIIDTWSNMSISNTNAISKFMKKLRHLKLQTQLWVRDKKESATTKKAQLKGMLKDIDILIDEKKVDQELLNKRMNVVNSIHDLEKVEAMEIGNWIEDPNSVKNDFFSHFKERFDSPCSSKLMLEGEFPNKLGADQSIDLESNVTIEEIKRIVWDCGIDKSPGPDGFTFELLFEEDRKNTSLYSKRICIKTKMEQNIFETFKIIIKGKVFWIRAKEVSGWIPDFLDEDEEDEVEDESEEDLLDNNPIQEEPKHDKKSNFKEGEIQSKDPFHIYDMLVKKPKNDNKEEESSKATLKYPHGFTLDNVLRTKDVQDVDDVVEDSRMFHKHNTTISDYFVAIQGEWIANAKKYLVISVYAPQEASEKRMLWSYLNHMIDSKMSKLDRFLISEGIMGFCPNITSITLDRYLSDHRPIILREAQLKGMLKDIDILIDEKKVDQELLNKRMNVINSIHDLEKLEATEIAQKAKIKWSIEGDENSKFFHGILNKKRNQHAIRGILSDGNWIKDPNSVKNDFFPHFKERFDSPCSSRLMLEGEFPNKISADQSIDLKSNVTIEEIKRVVWDCGNFPRGGNSSFIALIPKIQDAKVVKDYRPISLIGSSILVNGSPTGEFQFRKGLKQCDPLSTFLFLLIMESLHFSFQNLVNECLFKGVSVSSSLYLSHLFYVDDVIFMGQWSVANINTLVQALDCFYKALGLRMNLQKSKLMGISVEDEIVSRAASKMGCCTLTTHFLYPGVKVGGSMSRIKARDEIETKLHSRLSKWKMKNLSSGGRLTLLKSVLGSSPIYYMSIYKVPSKVLKCLKDIRRKFFIGADVKEKKMSWFKWSRVLASKDKGGLGVSSFFALNRALLFKWMWHFFNDKDRIYALESDKNLTVADKMAHNDTAFSLHRQPRDGVEMEQFRALSIVIEGVLLHDMVDRWKWTLEGSGEFLVASAKKFIDNSRLIGSPKKTRWIKIVPIKVNILAWKVQFDLLPTHLNLSRREWLVWFFSLRISSKHKELLEGIYYAMW
nr:RNA-directed DNA polymerase, eukaryota, reverse transcriptase zinc-binding domain protein [Tanacetum cinerariifolium]